MHRRYGGVFGTLPKRVLMLLQACHVVFTQNILHVCGYWTLRGAVKWPSGHRLPPPSTQEPFSVCQRDTCTRPGLYRCLQCKWGHTTFGSVEAVECSYLRTLHSPQLSYMAFVTGRFGLDVTRVSLLVTRKNGGNAKLPSHRVWHFDRVKKW